MKELLFGLAYLVVVLVVLRLVGRLLIKYIYGPLVRFCDARGLNASPWGLVIWEALMIYEYSSRTGYELFFQHWKFTRWMSPELYGWVLLGLAALPFIVMLVKTRVIYFIPLLAAKLLGIPFFIIGFLVGVPDAAGEERSIVPPGWNLPDYNGIPVNYRNRQSDQQETEAGGMPEYMREKYDDQYRAGEGGEGYSTTEVGGQTAYYKGDYAPFGSDGEHREYDSDYSPMD